MLSSNVRDVFSYNRLKTSCVLYGRLRLNNLLDAVLLQHVLRCLGITLTQATFQIRRRPILAMLV